jgi:type II secretory ATPase GspE/PulE/Tfp pilus assembly ATPase PilB-like protein
MIGEIRDLETAKIAIQASLTGHLVFATLHTNDALSAIVRLQDMGVEPYLVASSLVMAQAQRLVRRLCEHCKSPRSITDDDRQALEIEGNGYSDDSELYEACGCDHCMHTGFLGRVAIYEMAIISDAMRNAIHHSKGLPALRRIARKEGMKSLRQDGARHVLAGVTTVDEVVRVSQEEMMVVEA